MLDEALAVAAVDPGLADGGMVGGDPLDQGLQPLDRDRTKKQDMDQVLTGMTCGSRLGAPSVAEVESGFVDRHQEDEGLIRRRPTGMQARTPRADDGGWDQAGWIFRLTTDLRAPVPADTRLLRTPCPPRGPPLGIRARFRSPRALLARLTALIEVQQVGASQL